MATVYERVKAIVVDKLRVDPADISSESHLEEDLKADSLDLVELIMAFEEEFSTPKRKLEIPDEEAGEIRTISQVVAWLNSHGVEDEEEVISIG